MRYGIGFDEDVYWDRILTRELDEYDSRYGASVDEEDTHFLDEEDIEEIEAAFGCEMSQLDFDELIYVVEKWAESGAEIIEAEWNASNQSIWYKYTVEM